MFDHFSLLAPIYERLIPPPSSDELGDLLTLTPSSVLLDAAGGTGRVSAQFAPDVGRIVVCDSSEGMLAEARTKGLETVLAETEQLPFENCTFDCVMLVDAYHHLKNQQRSIAELLRVLKPDGTLVIEEPDLRRPLVKFVALLEKLFLMRSHFVRVENMISAIQAQGGHATLVREGRFRIWLSVTKELRSN